VRDQTGVTPGPTTAGIDTTSDISNPDLGASIAQLQNKPGETVDRSGMAAAGSTPLEQRRNDYFDRQDARKQENLDKPGGGGRGNFFDRADARREANKFGSNIGGGGGGGGGGGAMKPSAGGGGGNDPGQYASRGHYLQARQNALREKQRRGGFSGNVGFAAIHPMAWKMPHNRPLRRRPIE